MAAIPRPTARNGEIPPPSPPPKLLPLVEEDAVETGLDPPPPSPPLPPPPPKPPNMSFIKNSTPNHDYDGHDKHGHDGDGDDPFRQRPAAVVIASAVVIRQPTGG